MTRDEIKLRFPNASEAFIRANCTASILPGSPACMMAKVTEGKPRIRQERLPNKTEAAFALHVRRLRPYSNLKVYEQGITLRLANGVKYKPDVFTWSGDNEFEAWEVKGFKREASIVRLKMAASVYPMITFYLVTKRKKQAGGDWQIEKVLP